MIYLKSFKLSPHTVNNPNAYPYNMFKNISEEVFVFNNITVLYGNNGSGKSTLLNIIANKLDITGAEEFTNRDYPLDYMLNCSYSLGENQGDGESSQLPPNSLYIKSEDILYEIKKIQQEAVLKEGYLYQHAKLGYTKEHLEKLKESSQMYKQIEIMKFANEKYSNGETSMQIFDEYLVPNGLYLLDEPETSLSPTNQIQLAEEINKLVRFFNCQFIIATHSPFMLGTLDAKIYNLDAPFLRTSRWSELENVRFFYDFFKERKNEFE
ncbi:AAA family ATPase [Bacillus sporothermodurans]|uniref:AAA family ATPase n=1 Tax=Heyndrickxia sporothermodurans TaxID=46224 RepID=UPI00192B0ECE|nr:AAA family ATPase [Heyndrickxia sporothermodurans]MBL5766863.1 AAA family ATPase [Heyndrickxia sporothermodurans]MBL5770288.1 AAA family ATPase [Heyndrickxia sporothermodurans]MBL5776371.1 AAA family ATPase [Heyndrickxia sporothermodurans]MBL5784713.1 AAA family ATPase [Heyndrickxia sporothermodurans]MBL5788115.1 AAA family ATPase [Heyndrickxia sporothermodurans]